MAGIPPAALPEVLRRTIRDGALPLTARPEELATAADWQYHGVTALLAEAAGDRAGELGLAGERRSAIATQLARRRQLLNVADALNKVDLQWCFLKGAAVAHADYAQPWLRPYTDFDVLVRVDQREIAQQALVDLGYRGSIPPAMPMLANQMSYFMSAQVPIDLHWGLSMTRLYNRHIDHDALLARAETIALDGGSLRVPDAEDRLLHAVLHRAAHNQGEERLIWFYDMHRQLQAIDGHVLWTRAGQWRLTHLVEATVDTLQALWQCDYPALGPAPAVAAENARDEALAMRFYRHRDSNLLRHAIELQALPASMRTRYLREWLFADPAYMAARFEADRIGVLRAHLRRLVGQRFD